MQIFRSFITLVLRIILRLFYNVQVRGVDNFYEAGERAVIVANHPSFLDGLLLGIFLPKPPTFAVNTHAAKRSAFRIVLKLSDYITVDHTNPLAIKSLINLLKKDKQVCIFPEGRVTRTGALMKIYDGPGVVAHKSNSPILPVRIEGAQYTVFSRLKGTVRQRWFPQITITILPPRLLEIPEDISNKEKRKIAGRQIYDLMTDLMFETSGYNRTIWEGVFGARAIHGKNHPIVEDIDREPTTYNTLITKSLVLGSALKKQSLGHIGILLPSSIANVVTFLAIQAIGEKPHMLNFSVGSKGLVAAIETSGIKSIITSNKFIELAKLQEEIAIIQEKTNVNIIYLERFKDKITFGDKLSGWWHSKRSTLLDNRRFHFSETDAVVLYTSGSEGTPKGVVLTHKNVMANVSQIAARVDFTGKDIVLNVLPMFHSFGLTAGTILPLVSGIKIFFYPSPLHYRIVPQVAYDINATILFGTNTFLAGYAKYAHPYDFSSIRYVFAGAEKLQESVRRVWSDTYGVRIFEGYGTTEASPVLAVNTPMDNKPGSVGRLLPGIGHKLAEVPGVENGGRLSVNGPNIMRGYQYHPSAKKSHPFWEDFWYDTGDIVEVDEDGFVFIKGRAKRFAKIGGEMVSLAMVEGFVSSIWPDNAHAVVSIPDEKKGEKLVLVTDRTPFYQDDVKKMLTVAKEKGISTLQVPASYLPVEKLALLGSGKVDYVSIKKQVESWS